MQKNKKEVIFVSVLVCLAIAIVFYYSSFPQLFYPLMTRQFFCDFHEKSEDFCVS